MRWVDGIRLVQTQPVHNITVKRNPGKVMHKASCVAAIITLFTANVLVGCSAPTGGWNHSNRTTIELQTDYKNCTNKAESRTLATRLVGRAEYGLETQTDPRDISARAPAAMTLKQTSNIKKRFKKLLHACMESRGYSRND